MKAAPRFNSTQNRSMKTRRFQALVSTGSLHPYDWAMGRVQSLVEKVGVSLGPIALSLGESSSERKEKKNASDGGDGEEADEPNSAMGKVQSMVGAVRADPSLKSTRFQSLIVIRI